MPLRMSTVSGFECTRTGWNEKANSHAYMKSRAVPLRLRWQGRPEATVSPGRTSLREALGLMEVDL